MRLRRLAIFLLLICAFCRISAQKNVKDSIVSIHTFGFSGGIQVPYADLSERFGTNGAAGFSYHYKNYKNFLLGIEGNLIFGANVKNSQLLASDIRTAEGLFIDNMGLVANVLIQERGVDLRLVFGKILPVFGPNQNSGLVLKGGVGFLQHRIRFEARENEVPQIEGDAQHGYDKLSNGLSISQFIGYHQYGNRNRLNFSIGLEFMQGFTQSRRDFNIDLMAKDESKRLDGLVGLKGTWLIPFFKRSGDKYYTY